MTPTHRHRQHPDHVITATRVTVPTEAQHGSYNPGTVTAQPGDWIVVGPNERGVFSDERFTEAYEEIK